MCFRILWERKENVPSILLLCTNTNVLRTGTNMFAMTNGLVIYFKFNVRNEVKVNELGECMNSKRNLCVYLKSRE